MPVRIIPASIFDSKDQVLVNPVNCVGVMGAGLALEFKHRYPAMFQRYQILCRNKDLRPGQLWIHRDTTPWVMCFPTKDHWRNPSQLQWIEQGLYKLWATHASQRITSIALPKLGCGYGGLSFEHDVRPLIERYFAHSKLVVNVYTQ